MDSRGALITFQSLEIIFENSFWKKTHFLENTFWNIFLENREVLSSLNCFFMEIVIGKFSLTALVRYFYGRGWTTSGRTCQNHGIGMYDKAFCSLFSRLTVKKTCRKSCVLGWQSYMQTWLKGVKFKAPSYLARPCYIPQGRVRARTFWYIFWVPECSRHSIYLDLVHGQGEWKSELSVYVEPRRANSLLAHKNPRFMG